MDSKIVTRLAGRPSDLEGILSLQSRNLRRHLGDDEAAEQGFLIAEFDLGYLARMNDDRPSVVAVDGDRVVGYALAVTRRAGAGHPFLAALFHQIDQLDFNRVPLRTVDYVVVGQLCVDKEYRGKGLVPRLYRLFRESLQGEYLYGITDVARANKRSLQAHLKTGFQVIHSIEYGGLEWDVVLWDWTLGTGPSEKGGEAASGGTGPRG